MSQSTVNKNVGSVTKISTMSRTVTSSTSSTSTSSTQHQLQQKQQQQQQQQQKQQQQQQQQQTNQKVMTKQPNKAETEKKDHTSVLSRAEGICVRCNKTVYKMEEVIAEQQIWHKNCFKCKECDKTLNRHSKVDSFQIREGVVYCKPHFKQLFGVADGPKRRPELVISENQPSELPDNVIRSSKQHDLGLENIETAAVKRRFRLFEKIGSAKEERSADYDYDADSIHSEDYDDDVDVDLIRAKRAQRERPSNFEAMNEIKSKFEAGMEQGRQARYEERKQEIQNIRSKLFSGKLARTTEMYQNALQETTASQRIKGSSLAHDLDNIKSSAKKAQNAKQQFETGEVYRSNPANNNETDDDVPITKQNKSNGQISNKVSERMQMIAKQQAQDKLIKSHAKVKMAEKADIQNQFEFFENYNPEENNRNETKIPPNAAFDGDRVVEKAKSSYIDRIQKSKTMQSAKGDTNGKTKNQSIRGEIKSSDNGRSHDNKQFETSEISSREPAYLDSDLEQARLAARTKELKDLYERWNYENNVYDTTEYNDSIPEYDEIDESQTETTKTIRAKFENLPHSGRMQNAKHPTTNRFVD